MLSLRDFHVQTGVYSSWITSSCKVDQTTSMQENVGEGGRKITKYVNSPHCAARHPVSIGEHSMNLNVRRSRYDIQGYSPDHHKISLPPKEASTQDRKPGETPEAENTTLMEVSWFEETSESSQLTSSRLHHRFTVTFGLPVVFLERS